MGISEKKFTNELKQIFDYIHNTLLKEYKCDKICTEYFVLAALEKSDNVANKVLSKIMLTESLDGAKAHYNEWMAMNIKSTTGQTIYDSTFEDCIQYSSELSSQQNANVINSGHVLSAIFIKNQEILKYFKSLGVSLSQILTQVREETNALNEELKKTEEKIVKGAPVKHKHKRKEKKGSTKQIIPQDDNLIITAVINQSDNISGGECEKLFINLNNKAESGEIGKIIGQEDVYDEIYAVLSKKSRNNVVITGESGIGKTGVVRNLSNLIINSNVPKEFKNKILFEIDINTLFSGTSIRGVFEAKMKSIIHDAERHGNYIFFIDSLSSALSNKNIEDEMRNFIDALIKNSKIMFICTCSDKGYARKIGDNPEWERYFTKISMTEPSEEECIEILKYHSEKLGYFHNVEYDEKVYETCVKLAGRYITERKLPDSAIDILDCAGAKMSLTECENSNIRNARQKLSEIKKEKERLKISSSKRDYGKLDELERQEIELQKLLDIALKNYNLEKKPFVILPNDIRECISSKTGIELKNMSIDDKEKLKGLNDRIKSIVIGQDEAVDNVCKAIKRQRVGISNPNKPVVLFFGGTTGVGKTFLCKTLAKELWGDEKQIIRLDMSEYSEQTSVTKLYGAPPSYVGYGDSGSLVDKLKMKKNCILLLDEIEKADEKVYNVFLQLFDEGRLTDSKGNMVDCKNIVVIMTSNIAAKKLINNKPVGFVVNLDDTRKNIIDKELKKHFNPEFLNRIDSIIYFNRLTKKDIKEITLQKIKEIETRVNSIGYFFEKDIKDEDFISYILSMIEDTNDLGARPIEHKLQELMVDKICDKIINNDIKIGEFFKKSDFITT